MKYALDDGCGSLVLNFMTQNAQSFAVLIDLPILDL